MKRLNVALLGLFFSSLFFNRCMANLNGKLLSANDFRCFLDMLNSRFKNKTSEEARKIALGKIEINEEQFDEYQRCLAYSVYSGAKDEGILGSCLRVFDGDKRSMDYLYSF